MSNPTARGLVNDLSTFKSFCTVAKKHKGKGKEKSSAADLPATTKEPPPVKAFLSAVNWTAERFREEFQLTLALMEKIQFDRDDRLSRHRGCRMVTMSGVPWNIQSRHRERDWSAIAVAVTVESALVEQYRGYLLKMCPGARGLRNDLHDVFFALTAHHSVTDQEGQLRKVRKWEFADAISSNDSDSERNLYDLDHLMKQWRTAHAARAKDIKDPILTVIQNLEKNKLLACSAPDAPPGTIETLAHHLISGLSEVGSLYPVLCVVLMESADHV